MQDGFRGGHAPDDGAHDDEGCGREPTPDGLLILEQDLAQWSGTGEGPTARVARLEADWRIVDILRRDGFTGPRYDKAAAGWWSYGWRTMVRWSGTGEIFTRARAAGRPVPPSKITTSWSKDDRYQVATDTMIGGMELFRERGLLQGGWTPDGGASLTTYVVGAAIRCFRPAYLTWFRDQQAGHAELAAHDEERDIPDQRAVDPYYYAATTDELARILPHITDNQVREGLGWRSLGYTQAEAAERVGLSEKALERRLSRTRIRILNAYLHQPELGEGGTR
ncbi:RNA polymerase sigma factor [Streptomyces sp. NPDC102381]|uniref:RNA polymerase sigma factor n=1 Tax=Streptomyces sp. NPDC102381 TaxID=3366164 RepID=UPI00381934D5